MELSFDTSTRYASVAVSAQGEVTAELAWRSERNHSVEFVPALRRLMRHAGVEIGQIEAVFVARGPGGFSALRVGISVAKSIAAARSIPIVAVGTLEIEAHPYLGLGVPLCAVVGAGRKKVYAALYPQGPPDDPDPGPRYSVETHDGLASLVTEGTLLCGEGAVAMAGHLRQSLGIDAATIDSPPPTRRPAVLAHLGYGKLQAGDADDAETLQPHYMHGSQFEAAQRRLRPS